MKTKLMFFGLGAIIGGALAGLSVYIWQKREIDALTEALEDEMLRRNKENQEDTDELVIAHTQLQAFIDAIDICPVESAKRSIVKQANEYINERVPDDIYKRRGWTKDTPDMENEEGVRDGEEESPAEELIGPPPPETDEDAPYVIDERDYLGNPDDYKQAVLMYYAEDDTLIDEDDDVIDPDACVGSNNLFAFTDTDDPAIFIRNDRLRMLYEVIWENGTYQEMVMGTKKPLRCQRIYRDIPPEEEEDE